MVTLQVLTASSYKARRDEMHERRVHLLLLRYQPSSARSLFVDFVMNLTNVHQRLGTVSLINPRLNDRSCES